MTQTLSSTCRSRTWRPWCTVRRGVVQAKVLITIKVVTLPVVRKGWPADITARSRNYVVVVVLLLGKVVVRLHGAGLRKVVGKHPQPVLVVQSEQRRMPLRP